ncbi:uncharacterized protein LOC125052547 [Pieris napi]|uniref:uncharacterized protein LOC125052547 n=1 Tax=Pieris napi TaxID=78633 RepID=UPI001FB8AB5E|nr:uncharacterized protein LOC125052547 [Pieris napi]
MCVRRDEKMLFFLLLAYLLINSACEDNFSDQKSKALIVSLRKKLTKDNYDYSSAESMEIHRRAESRENDSTTATALKHTPIFNNQNTKTLYLKDTTSTIREGEPLVSQNDLLYYVDDRHLLPQEPVVKYKVLKVKHNSRRSGGERLIQEESKDGVAIINLGGGPFPEFRLPRSRRQYMQDFGELISDEDDLLPHLNDSSPHFRETDAPRSEKLNSI